MQHSLAFQRFSTPVIIAAAALVIAPSAARAEFYAGASVGKASVEADFFDENDTSKKLIFGYVFDLPVVDFSLETSYVDFGSPHRGGAQIEITGLDAFAVAGLDFGFMGVFAKAGVISWDGDSRLGTFQESSSGTDSAYGIGARFNVASLFVRAEYEKFDIKDTDDVDMLSVGVVWRF